MAICAGCGDGGLPHTLKTTSNGSSQKCYSDGNRILTGKSECVVFTSSFQLFTRSMATSQEHYGRFPSSANHGRNIELKIISLS